MLDREFEIIVLGGRAFFRFADGLVAVDQLAMLSRYEDQIVAFVSTGNPSVGLYEYPFSPLGADAASPVDQG